MRTWYFSLISVALISIGILSVIFFNINPYKSGTVPLFGFFFTLFLAIFSILAVSASLINVYRKQSISKNRRLLILRRCAIITFAVVGLLLFSALKVLNFLSAINFILALALLEIFFINKTRERLR